MRAILLIEKEKSSNRIKQFAHRHPPLFETQTLRAASAARRLRSSG
jgi:hypothetical protein